MTTAKKADDAAPDEFKNLSPADVKKMSPDEQRAYHVAALAALDAAATPFVEFPKWKYSPEQGSCIVQTAEEEKALKGTWYDSTADFPKAKEPK